MSCNLVDVIAVKALADYQLYLKFDDGAEGQVDLSKLITFKGVFEPLSQQDFFSSVSVNPDIGTICWRNGADISPSYLRENLQTNT